MILYIWRKVFSPIRGRFFIKIYGMLSNPGNLLLQLCSAISSSDLSRYLLKSSLFLVKRWCKDVRAKVSEGDEFGIIVLITIVFMKKVLLLIDSCLFWRKISDTISSFSSSLLVVLRVEEEYLNRTLVFFGSFIFFCLSSLWLLECPVFPWGWEVSSERVVMGGMRISVLVFCS